jgi:hypothetical protein
MATIYSVLYGHLSQTLVKEGQILTYGDRVGIMGSTGYSTGNHLHTGAVEGAQTSLWRLADMNSGRVVPNKRESNYFVQGDDLFIGQGGEKRRTLITTDYLSDSYYRSYGVKHPAYDLIDSGAGLPIILWNRTIPGKVVKVAYDGGYGNYIIVQYSYDKTVFVPPAPKPNPKEPKATVEIVTVDGVKYKKVTVMIPE